MRAARKLVLKRERLTELRSDELRQVAGGDAVATTPLTACASQVVACDPSRLFQCDSLLRPCISHTCTL